LKAPRGNIAGARGAFKAAERDIRGEVPGGEGCYYTWWPRTRT